MILSVWLFRETFFSVVYFTNVPPVNQIKSPIRGVLLVQDELIPLISFHTYSTYLHFKTLYVF